MRAQRLQPQRLVSLTRQARHHRTRRNDLADVVLDLALLGLRTLQHAVDRALVLALQRAQLVQLFDQAALSRHQRLPHLAADALNDGQRLITHAAALGRHQQVDQRALQRGQAAARQQRVVVRDLGHQTLLRRYRKHARAVDRQRVRRAIGLARDLGVDLGRILQRIPQAVDLVEHRQVIAAAAALADDVAPDLEIALGHAGIGRQNEEHGVRAGDQRQRQLGLGTDRVQAGGVENHQTLLEQRVRKVDHRMAPARDLDHAVVDRQQLVLVVGVEQPVHAGLFDGYLDGVGHQLERLQHAVRRIDIDREHAPFGRRFLQLRRGRHAGPGLDRQRANARRQRLVVDELGRAHRGAPGRRGQDAPSVVGEEDRVDQLTFATRELGHEGDDQLVLGQPLQADLDAARRVGFEQLIGVEPDAQAHHCLRQRFAPLAVLLETACQLRHQR